LNKVNRSPFFSVTSATKFFDCNHGVASLEYLLILGALSVGLVVALSVFAQDIIDLFLSVTSTI
jgi:Flp pilus assembly pilin Flp